MSQEPDSLVLVDLTRMDGRLERIEDGIGDIKRRLSHVEDSVATWATGYAGVQLRMDRMDNRLDRIERRLELHDAQA